MASVVAGLAVAVVGAGTRAAAASFSLTEAQKRDAMAYGAKSATVESFGGEWRVEAAAGESVTVMTPFHRLALAARHAAFRNEPLKASEPDRLLREQRNRLVLLAELRGRTEDFAQRLAPELVVGTRTVKPAFVQNEHTALRRDDGYVARCRYEFSTKELPGDARVSLVVRDAGGRPASAFTIDLARMR